jgi:UDP-N-acetyl-D-glucosamine dehydrogenase
VAGGSLPQVFREGLASGRLSLTTDPDALRGSEIIAICVPTPPLNDAPDMSLLEAACRTVAQRLTPSTLVILESAAYPGATDDFVCPILESSGLQAGRDFLLACAPYRADPGNTEFSPRAVPRVVGGRTPEATGVAALFYGQLLDKVVTMSSCRAAELTKFLEQTFRYVNVALANEMARLCHERKIDVWEVIEAASTKPFGFMPFYPGPGVGGHGIPLDQISGAGKENPGGQPRSRILERAHQINRDMPAYVAHRISQSLAAAGKAANEAGVLVLGVAYKPDSPDLNESPALRTIHHLLREGAQVSFHDPYVSEVMVNGRVLHRTELTRRSVESADCVAVLTPHRVYDLEWIAEHAQLIFDARNAYRDYRNQKIQRL